MRKLLVFCITATLGICMFAQDLQTELLNRFLNYVSINSQSQTSEGPKAFPMTEGQKEMARCL